MRDGLVAEFWMMNQDQAVLDLIVGRLRAPPFPNRVQPWSSHGGRGMAEHPNAAAARASLEALKNGDVETMAAGIADDAVWHVPGSHRFAGEFVGKSAIVERFQAMGQAGLTTGIDEIHDILGNDDHVVALLKVTFGSAAGSTSQMVVWTMHVRDGMATEFWARNADQAEIDRIASG